MISAYFEAIKEVYSYAPEITDWLILKKELLKVLKADYRILFGNKDDKKNRNQTINDFEMKLAEAWTAFTKNPMYFKNEKIFPKP